MKMIGLEGYDRTDNVDRKKNTMLNSQNSLSIDCLLLSKGNEIAVFRFKKIVEREGYVFFDGDRWTMIVFCIADLLIMNTREKYIGNAFQGVFFAFA